MMATAEKVIAKSVGQLDHAAVEEISAELRHLLADLFALYLKTKNFHWHMTGKHFRDYHLEPRFTRLARSPAINGSKITMAITWRRKRCSVNCMPTTGN
jgi:hypothetical protein